MSNDQGGSVKSDIRRFFTVIFSGVFAAMLLSAAALWYFSPGGTYLLENILIAPAAAVKMDYTETDPATGGTGRYVFDHVQWLAYNAETKAWVLSKVDPAKYSELYRKISGETSMQVVPEHVVKLFQWRDPSILSVVVRKESGSQKAEPVQAFQEVQFSFEGDYYRVDLSHGGGAMNWAYFYHPGISNYVQSLFGHGN